MLESTPTEVRPRKRSNDAHFAHVALHGFPIHLESLIPKLDGNSARAVEWAPGVNLVDRVLDSDFRRIAINCLVVETGPIDFEELRLREDRQITSFAIDHRSAFSGCRARDQIFFSATRSPSRAARSVRRVLASRLGALP